MQFWEGNMNQPDQTAMKDFCAMVAQGFVISDNDKNPISDLSQILRFPEEILEWIGSASIPKPVFDPKTLSYKHNEYNVHLGISPYRIVFAVPGKKMQVRSFWWEVSTEGQIFQDGSIRYKGFYIEPPLFRSGMLQRDILIRIFTIPAEGSAKKVKECMLFDLKWKNPASGKMENKKGQEISDLMMAAYNQRIPLTMKQLWDWFFTGKVEPVEIKPAQKEPLPSQIEKETTPPHKIAQQEPALKTTPAPSKIKQQKPAPKITSAPPSGKREHACPKCGNPVERGWKVCPFCATLLPQVCAHCGKPITDSHWVACPYCGTKI